MQKAKTPRSLRASAVINSVGETSENQSGRAVSAVVGLMAVASFSGAAEAQQSNLPPVTVDASRRASASRRIEADGGSGPRPQCPAARGAAVAAGGDRPGAVSECRRAQPGPQSLCGCGGALQGRSPAGVGQVSRTDPEHAEDHHGAQQGSAGGQERHHAEAGDPEHRRRDLGHGRGRQRLRRPLLHSRLRCPQRHLHRRRPRFRRQRPRKLLHRAGRNPARTRLVLCRPRHHRRRDQHRHQAGDHREVVLQHGYDVRDRFRPSGCSSTSTR